jgi:hypothetical protein
VARAKFDGVPSPLEICTYCQRQSQAGVLDHTASCKVGRVTRAVAALKNPPSDDVIADRAVRASLAENRCPLCDWPLKERMADGCVAGSCSFRPREGSAEALRWDIRRKALARIAPSDDVLREMFRKYDAAELAAMQYGAPLLEEVRPVAEREAEYLRRLVTDYDKISAERGQPERRVVCGSAYPFAAAGHTGVTCDREVGHSDDPDSNHWNREAGFSWPTAARIAEETALANPAFQAVVR